ncbi:diguanylate cyclase [Erythrobacter sp. sf7]|uniref:diguanylate cyclase n=1 Tax=Erythrobacter fulvus TaxID=2987523 RepID=A0ABT5JQG7_9SPHN|nr:diguanylate cyclase [Erythrobacter fulvus]MDC8755011.1 diguanylate cyclase [Erythrobacter fulvus]
MVTGIDVPLEAAIAGWLAALVLGVFIGRAWKIPRHTSLSDPLSGLFSPETLETAIESTRRRTGDRASARAVLHARLDQIAMLRSGRNAEAREAVLDHVAAVMKASIRRDDRLARVAGDGFTIVMSGADERAAKSAADRLRRALAQIRLPQFGSDNAFTASFGVAAGRADEMGDTLMRRALAALDAAQKAESDHVVAASEIEEVIYLPAPEPSTNAA